MGMFALFLTTSAIAEEIYTFGVVPQFDARRIQQIWQPILDQIYQTTNIKLTLKGAPSIPKFEHALMRGNYDFAYMNPYHLIKANASQGYRPIIRDQGRTLYGIIVTHKSSPINSIQDLNNKTVAFPAPNALGAALIPRTEFGEIFKIHITPKYVKSHSSVYLNVALHHTDAGGGVQKTLEQQPANIRNSLKVIYKTEQVAPHPVAAHPRIDRNVVQAIQNAFIEMAATKEGRAMLTQIPINNIGKANLQDYAPLKSMGLEKYYVE
jgi:phosphonate transport system substrate-binding protein